MTQPSVHEEAAAQRPPHAAATPPSSGRFFEANDASLYVEERGVGPPLVLIHGGLVSSALWEPLLPHLEGAYRAITPDGRGHGRSNNPSGQLSYTQLAGDLAALIDALDLVDPVVGGYSDGGQVALELGARHPHAARALIVGAAYPDFAAGPREAHKMLLGADDDGTPSLAQLEAHLGDFAELAKSWHPGGEPQWRALVQQTAPMWLDYPGLTPEDIAKIDVPVLVFAGDRDEMFPLDLMVSLYHALPKAELAVCPSADHMGPVTPERAEVFASAIRDFAVRHGATDE